jgi:transposase-like protein
MSKVDRNNPRRARSSESTYTLMDFDRDFPDDAACMTWLVGHLYPNGIFCPKCAKVTKHHRVASRTCYACQFCGHQEYPMRGTIFEDSATSLRLWFHGFFLMAQTRCGISAKQLERELGVTYKTAWRMFHLIRTDLMGDDESTPLSGDVEMDETYVGGKPRGREVAIQRRKGLGPMQAGQAAARAKKTTVFGMVERGGRVVARVVPTEYQTAALSHVEARVLPASSVYTDEAPAYLPLTAKGYHHSRIQHSAKVYVEGTVHTNTIEGFWSLLKRGIGGVHHSVWADHLQGYLNEYSFRYNHREDPRGMFNLLLRRIEKAAAAPS